MSGALPRIALYGALAAICVGCEEPGTHPTLAIEAVAEVRGVVFLDLDGNAQLNLTDSGVARWPVHLVGGNGVIVATTLSDSTGAFRFQEAPAGRVVLEVDRRELGDTLRAFGSLLGREITLGFGDTVVVSVGFTYPMVPLAALDSVPIGRKVFTDGIALNALVANGPQELHLRAGEHALRTINVVRRAINAGDSVRVLGRRAVAAGQTVLTDVEITPLRAGLALPRPHPITTGAAASAAGGSLDADLAIVRTANLREARNELGDVILTVDDGSGPVEILVRSFLGSDATSFNPATHRIREATGLLIPLDGTGEAPEWRLAIRASGDLRLEARPKAAGGTP